MNDQDILVPDKVDININGRNYQIGVLTLNQIIKLGKLLGKVLMSSQDKLKQLSGNQSNAQDLFNLLELLDEQDTAKFFSIVLKEPDLEFLSKINLDDTLEIIAVLCEHNKFEKVKKNFQRILNVFEKNEKSS